jgi:hypothetical protein
VPSSSLNGFLIPSSSLLVVLVLLLLAVVVDVHVGTAHKSAVLLQQSKLLVAILLEGATSEGGGSVGDGWNCGTSVATLHVVGEYRSIESVVVVVVVVLAVAIPNASKSTSDLGFCRVVSKACGLG